MEELQRFLTQQQQQQQVPPLQPQQQQPIQPVTNTKGQNDLGFLGYQII
jgi:hypothetical protein